MPLETIVKCDGHGCANVKQKSNHWFTLIEHPTSPLQVEQVVVKAFHPQDTHMLQTKFFCGRACVIRFLEKFMDEVSK